MSPRRRHGGGRPRSADSILNCRALGLLVSRPVVLAARALRRRPWRSWFRRANVTEPHSCTRLLLKGDTPAV